MKLIGSVQTCTVTMVKTLCVILVLWASLQTGSCQLGATCKRPKNGIGSCIVFQTCEYYVNILNELGVERATNILRNASCGFHNNSPLVCCPKLSCPSAPPDTTKATEAPPTKATEAPPTKATEAPPKENKSIENDHVPAFPDPPVCGLSKGTTNRVVGGTPAKLDEFPWMALLGYKGKGGVNWLCGGSLISERHVLTAAHCIHNLEDKLYVVRLGELDYAREDEGAAPIDFLINKAIKHEQYNNVSQENDIAILTLQKDVVFTDSIRPICIPKSRQLRTETFVGYNPFIAGWGSTATNGAFSTHLRFTQVPVRKNNDCVEAYRNVGRPYVIDQRVMCVGLKKGGKDSCQGDSGGPLMQPMASNAADISYYFVTGIVSFGRFCATSQYPGVYTRVTQFLPWIEEKVLGRTLG